MTLFKLVAVKSPNMMPKKTANTSNAKVLAQVYSIVTSTGDSMTYTQWADFIDQWDQLEVPQRNAFRLQYTSLLLLLGRALIDRHLDWSLSPEIFLESLLGFRCLWHEFKEHTQPSITTDKLSKLISSHWTNLDRIEEKIQTKLRFTVSWHTYNVEAHLGTGGYAGVFGCTVDRNKSCALKLYTQYLDAAVREYDFLKMFEYDPLVINASFIDLKLFGSPCRAIQLPILDATLLDRIQTNKGTSLFYELAPVLCRMSAHLEQKSVIHGDLKPENYGFLGGREGREGRWVLFDFNSASLISGSSKYSGTVDYRPPEAFFIPDIDSTAPDRWALGCNFYEMLTGEQLFKCRQETLDTLEGKEKSERKRLIENDIFMQQYECCNNKLFVSGVPILLSSYITKWRNMKEGSLDLIRKISPKGYILERLRSFEHLNKVPLLEKIAIFIAKFLKADPDDRITFKDAEKEVTTLYQSALT